MTRPVISDHWLRVIAVLVNVLLLSSFIFYAGQNNEKLNNLSETVHEENAGNRITALETRVETLVKSQQETNTAIWQLVVKLNAKE